MILAASARHANEINHDIHLANSIWRLLYNLKVLLLVVTVVAPADRPKSGRNSCVIERIYSVFVSFHLCIVCREGVFVIRLCYVAVCNNYAICNTLQTALNCNAVCTRNTLQTAFRVLKNADKMQFEINVQIKRSLK